MAEAESELVGGFHTEYSGMKFAMFYMAEFLSTLALGTLLSALFLGGWHGAGVLPGWLWMAMKTFSMVFVMIWIRGTWPRFRIDQLMGLAWKVLIPMSLANIFAAALCFFVPNLLGSTIAAVLLAGVFLGTTQLWLAPLPKPSSCSLPKR